eukprot:5426-Heterococcus_DN1.PRE.1
MVIILITCAATAAGLTVGMLSIEPLECVIKMRSGNDAERQQATRILPVIERHHLLLSTLMLFNSIANEVRYTVALLHAATLQLARQTGCLAVNS